MSDNVLCHWGKKGMKWGIRRWQNPDGSLTLAGKKRALKIQDRYTNTVNSKKYRDKTGNLTYAGRKKVLRMQDKYSKVTGGKRLQKYHSDGKTSVGDENKSKNKSISEMTNQEIQNKIDRIRLENTLRDLTPKHISNGQKFANSMKNAATSIIKDKGTKIVGDYLDKKVRNKLGLNSKSTSKILQEKAQEYENRQKIDKGQRYFKEGKYASQQTKNDQKTDKSSNNKTETYTGTVENNKTRRQSSSFTKNKKTNKSTVIDVEWREINDDDVNTGSKYVSQFLLEDKKKRRK